MSFLREYARMLALPSVQDFLRLAAQHCEDALEHHLPPPDCAPERLHQAMRYAVFAGGKRLRPALIMAAFQSLGTPTVGDTGHYPSASIAPLMAGIELLHTYTLVHDDLPAMDDDDTRRGQPSCHKAFDEATAILCGDALLTLAMQCMAEHSAAAVGILARASGSLGVVGGQQDDLEAELGTKSGTKSSPLSTASADSHQHALALLERIQSRKTAALIRASCELGALAAHASAADTACLATFGAHIGRAFQIADDILDVTADHATLGKTPGKDASDNKLTAVTLLGLDEARRAAAQQRTYAEQALADFTGDSSTLQAIAHFVIHRGH